MTHYQNHAGFQISNTKLCVVEVKNKDRHFILENIDEQYFDEIFTFGDKETKLITNLQNAFDELTKRNPLSSNSISFTLPSNVFNVFQIPYDEALTKNDLEEHINWELSILLANRNVGDFAIQTIKISNSRLREKPHIIILTLPKNWVEFLNKFCSRNNVVLRYIDNEHLSANNLLYLQNYLTADKLYLTILVRENYFSMILLEKNLPIKINVCNYSTPDNIAGVLNNELDKIAKEFDEVIDIDRSFIFGDSVSELVIKDIENNTGLNLTSVNPFLKIKKSEYAETRIEFLEKASNFAAAAGIAYRLV